MRPLAVTLVTALVLFSERVRCQVAVKGSGPILVKVMPAYPYAVRNQHLEGVGLFRLNIKPDSTVGSVTVLKTTGTLFSTGQRSTHYASGVSDQVLCGC